MKHLRAQAVEHGEADIGAVFGRIVVDPERALAEGHVDDLDDLVGHAAGGPSPARIISAVSACRERLTTSQVMRWSDCFRRTPAKSFRSSSGPAARRVKSRCQRW